MDFVIQKQQWTLGRLTVVANWFIPQGYCIAKFIISITKVKLTFQMHTVDIY